MFCIPQTLTATKIDTFYKTIWNNNINANDWQTQFQMWQIILFSLRNCRKNPLGVSAWKSQTKQAVPIAKSEIMKFSKSLNEIKIFRSTFESSKGERES
jgi:hypothetical protein